MRKKMTENILKSLSSPESFTRWLAKMKQAYLSSGRKAEWLYYLEGLKSTYSRRPALQAELRKL